MQLNFYKKQPKSSSLQPVEIVELFVKVGILMNNNLSENIKKIRKDNNLSQEQLAE